ncbi:MAG: DNA polymerase III subunit gamma/tau [Candidatus Izemoplasmatales bacterium]
MSYTALYRTYRPTDFNEVAGQEHITTTLKNALKNNKVAHAYLFTGPRGTGKTSIARIFAKTVNCEHAPVENPCNTCPNCLGIQDGSITDIIEIDAASNTGVDEIRELRDKVKYLPGYVKYKVYIIDEVHMLSTNAFNALLKTLEEPPAHVIFILCTTEPQKVPLTIISRCQRFDFKAITVKEIISKLDEIIAKEKIDIDKDAVEQIAVYAEGGLRDAIGLLDQAYAYDPDVITVEDINQICGAVSFKNQMEIVSSIRRADASAAIKAMDELIVSGKEVPKICQNLIQFFRDVLVYKNVGATEGTSSLYQNEDFINLANTMNNQRLFFYLDILNKAQNDLKWSNSPRLYLELAFIKMTDKEPESESQMLTAIDQLQGRIAELEKRPLTVDVPSITLTEEQPETPKNKENPKDVLTKTKLDNIIISDNVMPETDDLVPAEIDETKPCVDITKSFPIEFIEEVLNRGNREDKNDLIERWNLIRKNNASGNLAQYAGLLESGTLVASSKDKIIITFETAGVCNRLMKPTIKTLGKEILANAFKREIDYIALPAEIFQMISDEFISAWKLGKRQIKLSPIVCPDLRDVSIEDEEKISQTEQKIITDAYSLFGDRVKVKK